MKWLRSWLRKRPSGAHQDFPRREEGTDALEVHVAGVCVRQTDDGWYVLAAQRQSDRKVFPGKWECGGGQVRRGEGFVQALKRQFSEEFGLEVAPCNPLRVYEIPVSEPQQIIPGVRILCETREENVDLNVREFSEYRWLKLPVEEDLDWIGGIKEVLDVVALELETTGVSRLQIDLESSDLSSETRSEIVKCHTRFRSGDYDGAVTVICGVVDAMTKQIHEERELDNCMRKAFHTRILDAFKALEEQYLVSLRHLDGKIARGMWNNHLNAVKQAAHVVGALRRQFSDAHGAQRADPVIVQRTIDCAVFIARSLAGALRR